jgi:hypothetical protein
MSMIMYPARAVINDMRNDNEQNSKRKQPKLVGVPQLFGKQQKYPETKNEEGSKAMMMLSVPMPK